MQTFQTGALAGVSVTIALLMIFAGIEKRMLVWKPGRRCPVCGRTGRHVCTPRL